MKTHFEFIHFVEIEKKQKTSVWSCRNTKSGDGLGVVLWYPQWRQYCFSTFPGIILSVGCLNDIVSFLKEADAIRTGTHDHEPLAHTSDWARNNA